MSHLFAQIALAGVSAEDMVAQLHIKRQHISALYVGLIRDYIINVTEKLLDEESELHARIQTYKSLSPMNIRVQEDLLESERACKRSLCFGIPQYRQMMNTQKWDSWITFMFFVERHTVKMCDNALPYIGLPESLKRAYRVIIQAQSSPEFRIEHNFPGVVPHNCICISE